MKVKNKYSKEWKEKLSERMKGNKNAKGHKLSNKHKKAIIKSHKNKSTWNLIQFHYQFLQD